MGLSCQLLSHNNSASDTKGGNNLSLANGAGFTTTSRVGSHALTLNSGSTQFASVASAFNFTSGAFTFSFWLRLNSLSTPSPTQGPVVFFKGSYQVNGYYLQVSEAGQISFLTNQAGTSQSSRSSENLVINKWYHLAIVRNGSSVKIYINGADRTTPAVHSNPVSSSDDFAIGRYASSSILTSGQIDEFTVWSSALTEIEVRKIFDQQSCGRN